jgi:S1-C subfamily serine protease
MPRDELKNVTNIALKESTLNAIKTIDEDAFYISELGITVKEASPRGLLIIKIDKLSSLKSKGINNGDVILEADRGDIYSVDNLLDSIRNAMVDDFRPISLLIQGINDTFYASVELAVEND